MYDNDDDLNQWKAENNARSGRSNDFSTGSAGWNAHNAEKNQIDEENSRREREYEDYRRDPDTSTHSAAYKYVFWA